MLKFLKVAYVFDYHGQNYTGTECIEMMHDVEECKTSCQMCVQWLPLVCNEF